MAKQYSEKYDAYYDDETNEWLESKCNDPTCKYCSTRPEKPLEVTNETTGKKRDEIS